MKPWRLQIPVFRKRARRGPVVDLDWRLIAVGLRDCFRGRSAGPGQCARSTAHRDEVRLPSGLVLHKP